MTNIKNINQTTPDDVAEKLHNQADFALKNVLSIKENLSEKENSELQKTLDDIIAMSYLGKYYADKIKGALNQGLKNKIKQDIVDYQDISRSYLKSAKIYLNKYTEIMAKNYKSPLLARVGKINWEELSRIYKNNIKSINTDL